jgi:hypothetical protein
METCVTAMSIAVLGSAVDVTWVFKPIVSNPYLSRCTPYCNFRERCMNKKVNDIYIYNYINYIYIFKSINIKHTYNTHIFIYNIELLKPGSVSQ